MRLAVILLAGCAWPSPSGDAPASVLEVSASVAEIVMPDGRWATAFCIGANEWVTCRHVIAGFSRAQMNGTNVSIVVVRSGGDNPAGDWSIFRTDPPLHCRPCVFDVRGCAPGNAWVIGYGWPGGRRPQTQMTNIVPAVGVGERRGLWRLRLPSDDGYHGLSGAPIVNDAAVVVGLFLGRAAPYYLATRQQLCTPPGGSSWFVNDSPSSPFPETVRKGRHSQSR
jgi:Trypsin-like peptidase domain